MAGVVHFFGACVLLFGATPLCAATRLGEIPSFESFVELHGREFAHGSEEHSMRRQLYDQRVEDVVRQNQQHARLWTATVNAFSDRTEAELATLRGWRGGVSPDSSHHPVHRLRQRSGGMFLGQSSSEVLPDEKNWMHLNSTNSDPDQGMCGSCWAVASSLVLQAGAEINGLHRTFSVQELVSCVENKQHCGGTGGCSGATVELAMQYVADHGIRTDEEWPYYATDEGGSSNSCQKSSLLQSSSGKIEDVNAAGVHTMQARHFGNSATGMIAWERLPSNKYEPLMHALVKHGPVAVSVAARDWFNYDAGIFNQCEKDAVVDHAVTMVGYGKEGSTKYWRIKNSWGKSWGEDGTIRLLRQDDDDTEQCGIDRQPEVGTGCDGGPKEVPVCGMCGVLFDSVVPHFSSK
jgi:cathepsin L